MKKEDFVALGISEELAEKAAEASKKEFEGYVPKTRFNEEIQKKKAAEASYDNVKAELDKLKSSAGDNETLKNQIKDLQTELADKEKKYADEIAEMRMSNAIRSALGDTVHDADVVATLLDRSKLILSDDGKITGLDEQVNSLKESKAFLFKDKAGYPGGDDGGQPGGNPGGGSTRQLFADALNGII